jgi:hypothetical protein
VILNSGAFSEAKESFKTAKRTAKSVVLITLYLTGKIPIVGIIEIGLEQAPFVVFVYFFPHLIMQKTC